MLLPRWCIYAKRKKEDNSYLLKFELNGSFSAQCSVSVTLKCWIKREHDERRMRSFANCTHFFRRQSRLQTGKCFRCILLTKLWIWFQKAMDSYASLRSFKYKIFWSLIATDVVCQPRLYCVQKKMMWHKQYLFFFNMKKWWLFLFY